MTGLPGSLHAPAALLPQIAPQSASPLLEQAERGQTEGGGITPVSPQSARVVVLLATWNGAANLAEQLASFRAQSHLPWRVIVSDDGSTDETLAILQKFIAADPGFEVELRQGPRRGGAQNFMSLLQAIPPEADFVALSDQDDVWLPDKIARGLRLLARVSATEPVLLGGRSYICDAQLHNRRASAMPRRAPSFRHALVQNFAGGNTMMLNAAAIALIRAAAPEAGRVVVHDWWVYQLITGAGGQVIFDEVPLLLYRQHGANQIGANQGLAAQMRRMRWMLRGRFRRWNAINLAALRGSEHRLTAENRALLQDLARLQRAGFWERLVLLRRSGFYRQGLVGTLSLWLAAFLGRI